ncbi:thioredoxin [Cryptococcus depauperatus]|nr:thioredoxin [Cryptococcus depauperatus CBS 7855]
MLFQKILSSRSLTSGSFLISQRGFHATRSARNHYLDADTTAFEKRALDKSNSKPVLVDFYASWCQPCQVLTPLLKRVTSPESNYDLMTINVDDYPDIAGQYKVAALPTVVAFKDGKLKNKFVGFRGQEDIDKFLDLL